MRQIKSKQKNRIWWDNARIGTENDKRRHITDDDKEYMRQLYKRNTLRSHAQIPRSYSQSPQITN